MTNKAPPLELPGNYRFLMLTCILIASLGYVADGYKQKSTNACLQRLEQGKHKAMANFGKANTAEQKKMAAKYANYLVQNSDKVCDGL